MLTTKPQRNHLPSLNVLAYCCYLYVISMELRSLINDIGKIKISRLLLPHQVFKKYLRARKYTLKNARESLTHSLAKRVYLPKTYFNEV